MNDVCANWKKKHHKFYTDKDVTLKTPQQSLIHQLSIFPTIIFRQRKQNSNIHKEKSTLKKRFKKIKKKGKTRKNQKKFFLKKHAGKLQLKINKKHAEKKL